MIKMKYGKRKHRLGFYQVTPMPTQQELNKYYADTYFQKCSPANYSKEYSDDELEYFKNMAVIAEHVVGRNNIKKGKMIDVGCGEGFFVSYFIKRGWKVDCCDFSSFGISQQNPSLLKHFVGGDIYNVISEKVKNGDQYDFVNISNVLEHVREPMELLDLVKKIMKPNAILRIQVPNDFSDFQQLLLDSKLSGESWFSPPDHLNYFNIESIRKVFYDRKFSIMKIMADFPIEIFLFNEHSNYFKDRSKGAEAQKSRLKITNFLVRKDIDKYIEYMTCAADLGVGRSLIAFVRK
jgi:2-polyprenyl-3-methyl-5-hydroxy-6-metoxy-1,4-benzoquinol methylase